MWNRDQGARWIVALRSSGASPGRSVWTRNVRWRVPRAVASSGLKLTVKMCNGLAVLSALLYNYFTLESRHRLNTADLWVLELAELLENPRV